MAGKKRKQNRDSIQNHKDSGCIICKHPNASEIDDLFLNWFAPREILERFPDLVKGNGSNGSAAYSDDAHYLNGLRKHVNAMGLTVRQLNNWRAARRQTIRKGFLDISMLKPAQRAKIMGDMLAQETDERVAESQAKSAPAGTNILIAPGSDQQLTSLVRAAAKQLPNEAEIEVKQVDDDD